MTGKGERERKTTKRGDSKTKEEDKSKFVRLSKIYLIASEHLLMRQFAAGA